MPDLTGIHGNAQAQSSTSAGDISKLAEKMAEGLTEATLDGLVHAFQTIQNLRKNKKEEEEELPDNSVVPQSLAERKENLKHLKDRLNNETREFRRDVRKNAVKVGLNYILSLFKNVKKFLKDTWEAPGIFTRGIKNKFSSLKDFMLAETKGEVKIGQEIKGNKE